MFVGFFFPQRWLFIDSLRFHSVVTLIRVWCRERVQTARFLQSMCSVLAWTAIRASIYVSFSKSSGPELSHWPHQLTLMWSPGQITSFTCLRNTLPLLLSQSSFQRMLNTLDLYANFVSRYCHPGHGERRKSELESQGFKSGQPWVLALFCPCLSDLSSACV